MKKQKITIQFLLLLFMLSPWMSVADDTFIQSTGVLSIPNVRVSEDYYVAEMLHQGDLLFQLISANPISTTETSDVYDLDTGIVTLPKVIVDNVTYKAEMQHQSIWFFKVISAIQLTSESRSFKLEGWSDNWFAAYSDSTLIVEDSVPITTERSFNAETATFIANYPISLNVIMKDFKENDTGLEYIGERNQQMGDGGFIAQITDMSTQKIVAVSDSNWKCQTLHEAPLDTRCESESNPIAGVAPCTFNSIAEPNNWKSNAYDDSTWVNATEHSVADVSPKDGYDEINWDPSAKLIWGANLETQNTLICRITIEKP